MSNPKITEGKVLPFETKDGTVPGHAIRAYHYDWMDGSIASVVFERFDREADMPVNHEVHWTRWTKYAKRHGIGSVIGVRLQSGRMLHAEGRFANHRCSEGSYERAPLLARGLISVVTLTGGHTLLDIDGVMDYLHARHRDPNAASLILDPWARDNAEFDARMAALKSA